MPITNNPPKPQYRDVFFATNNPYQVNGPKGFTEVKYMEETHDLYVKLDFPGIKEETVVTLVEPSKKSVIVTGDAPKESEHDSSDRKYKTAVTGLICDSCEISNVQSFVEDGVVRLIISKNKINLHVPTLCSCAKMPTDSPSLADIIREYNPEGRRGTNPHDPAFTRAYESKQLPNGGLFLRIDMPGVAKDSFRVAVECDGVVTIMGGAPATMNDSSGRGYVGKVGIVPRGYDSRRIKIIAKHGVMRLIIPPY